MQVVNREMCFFIDYLVVKYLHYMHGNLYIITINLLKAQVKYQVMQVKAKVKFRCPGENISRITIVMLSPGHPNFTHVFTCITWFFYPAPWEDLCLLYTYFHGCNANISPTKNQSKQHLLVFSPGPPQEFMHGGLADTAAVTLSPHASHVTNNREALFI